MSLASTQSDIDTAVATLISNINSAQTTFFAANGYYWQGLISHETIPADGGSVAADNLTATPTDQSVTWDDFMGANKPGTLPAAIYVHTYKKPNGFQGYKIQKLFIYASEFYSSSVDSGNDSSVAWSSDPVPEAPALAAPTYTSVSPTSGSTAGGTSITITGTGFQSGATVTVGGSAATSLTVDSSTQITCSTPAGTGTVDIVITNIDGQSVTGSSEYTYSAGSAPAFVQAKGVTSSSSEPAAIVFDSTPTSGNVMIAVGYSNTGVGITPPTGWTQLNSGTTGQQCFWKKYAGEGNSFSFICGNSAKADRTALYLIEISGNNATPIDSNNASNNTKTSPSVTTSNANCLVVSAGCGNLSTDFATEPTGFTNAGHVSAGGGDSMATMAYKVFASAGATGTADWNTGTYSASKVFTVAVTP